MVQPPGRPFDAMHTTRELLDSATVAVIVAGAIAPATNG